MKLELFTDRLFLRPLALTDSDLSVELWTDPEIVKYICDVATEEEIRREMPDTIRRGGEGAIGIWCITDRKTGEKLGSAYLLPLPIEEEDVNYGLLDMAQMPDGDIEVGYFLKRSAWGKGYATEVCQRMLEFAFQATSLNALVASVHEDNFASKRVLEKSGFHYLGRRKCWAREYPTYEITRPDWVAIGQAPLA